MSRLQFLTVNENKLTGEMPLPPQAEMANGQAKPLIWPDGPLTCVMGLQARFQQAGAT